MNGVKVSKTYREELEKLVKSLLLEFSVPNRVHDLNAVVQRFVDLSDKYTAILDIRDREGTQLTWGDKVWFDHDAWWKDINASAKPRESMPHTKNKYNGESTATIRMVHHHRLNGSDDIVVLPKGTSKYWLKVEDKEDE